VINRRKERFMPTCTNQPSKSSGMRRGRVRAVRPRWQVNIDKQQEKKRGEGNPGDSPMTYNQENLANLSGKVRGYSLHKKGYVKQQRQIHADNFGGPGGWFMGEEGLPKGKGGKGLSWQSRGGWGGMVNEKQLDKQSFNPRLV